MKPFKLYQFDLVARMKNSHEIRDAIHVFIRLDYDEVKVLNCIWFQRLRNIHQLALSYLVYPGATHKRFEHSLGAMELAGRIFDVVTNPENVTDEIRRLVPEITRENTRAYWRRVVRVGALCHDIGHLPFSHAAEHALLPAGWSHEKIGMDILLSPEMRTILNEMTPPVRAEDVAKVALGPKKAGSLRFSNWEAILSEIIVGDAFGADRIDYLLRDSHHIGVAYGRFDHYRLIDTLRVLKSPTSGEPVIGVEEGGLHSAEALLLARYMMYTQVYFHAARRIYDIHLQEFLTQWLPEGKFPTDITKLIEITDNEVTAALLKAARDKDAIGHDAARRITTREHFRVVYQRNPTDIAINPEAGTAVYQALRQQFGNEHFRRDAYKEKAGPPDFPVLARDGRCHSSMLMSDTLRQLPVVAVDYVFVSPEMRQECEVWLENNRGDIIRRKEEEQ